MSGFKSVFKNSSYLASGHVVTKGINFLLLLVLTSYLGAEGFGLYSFAFSYVTIFMILSNLGINTLLTKEVAIDKSKVNSLVNSTISIVLILSALNLIITNLIPVIFGWSNQERYVVFLVTIFVAVDAFSRYTMSIFRAFEKMEYEAVLNIIEKLGMLLSALVCWKLELKLELLLISFIAVETVKSGLGFLIVRTKLVKISPKFDISKFWQILRLALPFALVTIFTSVSVKIDVVMLKLMEGDQVAGLYSTGRRIIESLLFLPETFTTALFPVLSVMYARNNPEFKKIYRKSFKIIVILVLPIVSLLFTFAPQIIDLLFKEEFHKSYIPLRWLSLALGILFVRYFMLTMMNSIGKQKRYSVFVGVGTLVNISLNYFLIPIDPFIGASSATIISELLIVLFSFISMKDLLFETFLRLKTIGYFLITLIISLSLYYLSEYNFLIVSFFVTLFYFVLLGLFKIISREDFNEFTGFMKSIKEKK